ncbi:unnamed protein product, partial [marine sediment metagenome]
MSKVIRMLSLSAVIVAGLTTLARSQNRPAAALPAGEKAVKSAFDSSDPLANWTITGDVTIDVAKSRQGKGCSLKIGPGGKALLKLRDRDESGRIDVWIYDDGTTPEDVKARRVGPRWGLAQSDGKVLAAGILYANYLGGDEGYT